MRRYDLAIFDFDGTLADSFPFFLKVYNELAREHGFREFAAEEVPAMRALPTREIVARSGMPAWKLPVVARDFTKRMHKADEVSLFEGVPGALQALHASGVKLAVVTYNAGGNVAGLFGVSLSPLFGFFECGASILGKKSRLKRAMRAMGVAPARSVYIGDTSADGDAAREAGLDFAAVEWGYGTRESLASCGPALHLNTVSELSRLLD